MDNTVAALIERFEGLEIQDDSLAREVLLAFGWRQTVVGHFMGPLTNWREPYPSRFGFDDDDFWKHSPLRNLNVAARLVHPGYEWTVGNCNENGAPWACVTSPDGDCPDFGAESFEPAIALCLASLRARLNTDTQGEAQP